MFALNFQEMIRTLGKICCCSNFYFRIQDSSSFLFRFRWLTRFRRLQFNSHSSDKKIHVEFSLRLYSLPPFRQT